MEATRSSGGPYSIFHGHLGWQGAYLRRLRISLSHAKSWWIIDHQGWYNPIYCLPLLPESCRGSCGSGRIRSITINKPLLFYGSKIELSQMGVRK